MSTTAASAPKPRARAARAIASTAARLWSAYRRSPRDETRNRLVEHYQPLVQEFVRRYAAKLPPSVDIGDLRTAANVGLMSAIEGFDAGRSVPFESYCDLRVRGALLDELRSEDWMPRKWRGRIEARRRAVEALRAELGREPADEEIANALSLPVDEYRRSFGPELFASAFAAGAHDEDGASAVDVVADLCSEPPSERLSRDDLLRLVTQKLSVQEYRIVYLKYWEELSLREIGDLMSLSESRVCKIHQQLIDRLRDRFRVGVDE